MSAVLGDVADNQRHKEAPEAAGQILLPSLSIRNFRCFRAIDIPKLGRVNLIVGKNGVGKSSILEAVSLLANKGNPRVITEILQQRDEYRRSRGLTTPSQLRFPIEALFYGRSISGTGKSEIKIQSSSGGEELSIEVSWRSEKESISLNETDDLDASQYRLPGIASIERELGLDSRPILSARYRGKQIGALSLDADPFQVLRRWELRNEGALAAFQTVHVAANGLPERRAVRLWDQIALTDLEGDAIKAVQIINPAIERMSAPALSETPADRTFHVKLADIREPVPLKSLGEGINRLLGIVLAMLGSRDGVACLDEIDSGLHWSVQEKLWDTIFNLATQLDVQVFATTHSYDCIEGFQNAASRATGHGVLVKLREWQGNIEAVILNEEELGYLTKRNFELR